MSQFEVGINRLVQAPGADVTSVQVASGYDPDDGERVVLCRLGQEVMVLTPQGADELADALHAEAVIARAQPEQGPLS